MSETSLDTLIQTLTSQGRVRLAQAIKDSADKTILQYSKSLYEFSQPSKIEDAFLQAFKAELDRLDYSEELKQKSIASLQKYPVIQTAQHIMPGRNPRPLCIDYITTLGLPTDAVYLSGEISFVPFSGAYKQGRMQVPQADGVTNEVNLIPSNMQDELIWNSTLSEKLHDEIKKLPTELQTIFTPKQNERQYTDWALRTAKETAQTLIQKPMAFFDIAEVARLYLLEIFKNSEHPLYIVFFDVDQRRKFLEIFGALPLFITHYESSKRTKTESLVIEDVFLKGEHTEILISAETLTKALKQKQICPNTFLVYLILAINGIRPLGSFRTIEYVPWFLSKLKSLELFTYYVTDDSYAMLTTGMFPAKYTNQPSLEYILKDESLPAPEKISDVIIPMAEILANDQANIYDRLK